MQIPEELLQKYNVPVPRYTSYPPANHFRDLSVNEYLDLIHNSNNSGHRNIAIYIHIPFCRKICYYCGCNSCTASDARQVDSYIIALKKEIKMISSMLDKTRKVSQVHYGGGTPNAIDLKYIAELNDLIHTEFRFIDDPEIAIECNPDQLGFGQVDKLMASGFNRISLGIQDFNEKVLKLVNRGLPVVPPAELFRYIKHRNPDISVNFDFIYGLPGQDVASFSETLEKATSIRPDRMVTFSYAHVPWLKKHQLILEKKGLPAPEEKMRMFLAGYRIMKDSGYEPLGLDHYVLPGDDLFKAFKENKLHRNFQGYCTRRTTGQVYAFGVTGINQLGQGFAQNTKEIPDYISAMENGIPAVEKGYVLSDEQKITGEVISKLMCNKKISLDSIADELNISRTKIKQTVAFNEEKFKEPEADGLLVVTSDGIEVTEKGTMFIRNIAALFDREYPEKKHSYSKTV